MRGSSPTPARVLVLAGGVVLALGAAVIVARLGSTRHAPGAAPAPLSVLQALGPGADDARYARALAPRDFHFPDDHGPHPEFRSEWWYWTGNLDGPDGRRFGYQFTVFRSALAPEPLEPRPSAWATRQFFMAHLALTDVASGAFYAFERTSRAALGLAGATARPFRVWVLDWNAARSGDAGEATPIRLRATTGDFALDLSLAAGKPIVLEGDRGLSQKGSAPGNASYYYSSTRMPTEGRVTVHGESFPVHGASWMDREWSTSALEAGQTGWDWFSLQLSDGRELMFYRLRTAGLHGGDGGAHGEGDEQELAHPMSGGTLVEANGASRHLTRDQVSLHPTGVWRSARSGVVYPSGFRLQVASPPLDLLVTPLIPDQELDVTFRYWEGAVGVTGVAGTEKITGRGYLELTGYGGEARTGIR